MDPKSDLEEREALVTVFEIYTSLTIGHAFSSMHMRAHCDDKGNSKRGTANGGAGWRTKGGIAIDGSG